jgi:SnoaL-like domain
MSQENVEVVKVANEAFVREGLDRFMEHFTDDVVYRAVEGAPDEPGPIHGKDAVRAWLQDWIDMFDGFWMELVELIDAGGSPCSQPSGAADAPGSAALKRIRPTGLSSRSATAKSRAATSTRPVNRPSKPPGLRSRRCRRRRMRSRDRLRRG